MKLLITLLISVLASSAVADGHKMRTPANPQWQTECGSCHLAYPPRLLSAENWRQMMQGLDRHFGANATLEAKENAEILAYLERYAGQEARYGAKSLRISDTPWFQRKHREVPSATWSHKLVKSPANCTACHVDGDKGDWSERGIRLPDGRRWE